MYVGWSTCLRKAETISMTFNIWMGIRSPIENEWSGVRAVRHTKELRNNCPICKYMGTYIRCSIISTGNQCFSWIPAIQIGNLFVIYNGSLILLSNINNSIMENFMNLIYIFLENLLQICGLWHEFVGVHREQFQSIESKKKKQTFSMHQSAIRLFNPTKSS